MKVALTGATGFLGRYVAQTLTAQGHEVVAWCRDPSTMPSWPSVRWVAGRLGDRSAANSLTRGVQAVVHAAFYRPGRAFIGDEGDPIEYFRQNVIGSLQLLEAAVHHDSGRFVFVSSGTVHDRIAPDRPLDERHPLWPSTLYGAYKASVETLIHTYGFSGKLDCCTVRPTAIYGIAEPLEQSKWFDLIRDIAEGKTVNAAGGSKEVHAADVARAITLLLQTETVVAGETFNCSDRLISRHEVAQIAVRLAGSKATIEGEPKQVKNTIDTTKLRQLGMQFGGTELLEATISEMIQHIRRSQR